MHGNRITHGSAMALRELDRDVVQGCQGYDEPGQQPHEGEAEAAEGEEDEEEEARSDEEEEDYKTFMCAHQTFDGDYIELRM